MSLMAWSLSRLTVYVTVSKMKKKHIEPLYLSEIAEL
jgi:hypothetical protein